MTVTVFTPPAPALPNTPEARRAGAILTIDLEALKTNWRTLAAQAPTAECAAVIKASAYGIDDGHAARALSDAGCKTFFVASIDEGIRLRTVLGDESAIHILNGLMDGAERDFSEHNLIPVLNSLDEIDAWYAFCTGAGKTLACDVHIDTGMSRLGLPHDELRRLLEDENRLSHLNLDILISHLAISEEPDEPMNMAQVAIFELTRDLLNPPRASLANSSGIFLGAEFHYDVVRPGVALYGVNPTPGKPNPMAQVVRLQGKILQVRTIDTPQTVGYGATYTAQGATRVATLSVGYADGYHRSASNRGMAYIGEHPAPLVGRVSMDLITIDVSNVPEALCRPGMLADLIGPHNPVDDVAERAGTIGYEVLTNLGARYHRVYVG